MFDNWTPGGTIEHLSLGHLYIKYDYLVYR